MLDVRCSMLNVAPVISPAAVIASVLPVYLLIVAGAVLRKTGILRPHHDEGIMRVVFTVMLPCFILDKILGNEVLRSGGVIVWAIGLGFCLMAAGIAIGWMVGRLMGLERGTGMRTFALASGCQNYGFTAIPVVEILWGGGALALLFAHNIGVEIMIWTVGVLIMSGERGISWSKLLNGPVIASTLGILLVVLGIDDKITGPPRVAMSTIGIGAFPLAILITGCSMMDLVGSERPNWKIIVGSALVRLALAPFVILCAAKYLPIATELKQVLLVQAAMPSALVPILLARIYGGRPVVAVQVVIGTTALSLLTLPWIITWGARWLDLKPMLP